MLSWLAITYTTARLGFEAQNAAVFRLLRLGAGKAAAGEIIPEVLPAEAPRPAMAIARKGRHALKKVHKKSAPVRKRNKRKK